MKGNKGVDEGMMGILRFVYIKGGDQAKSLSISVKMLWKISVRA